MEALIFLVKAIKAMSEVAGCAYLGQGIVGMISGAARDGNIVYVIFRIMTNPITKLARFVSPRFVPDSHVPLVGFGLVIWVWMASILALAYLYLKQG